MPSNVFFFFNQLYSHNYLFSSFYISKIKAKCQGVPGRYAEPAQRNKVFLAEENPQVGGEYPGLLWSWYPASFSSRTRALRSSHRVGRRLESAEGGLRRSCEGVW